VTQEVVLIFGRGGHALEVLHVAREVGVVGGGEMFTVVNDGSTDDRNLLPLETLSESSAADRFGGSEVRAIVAVGSSVLRRQIVGRIHEKFAQVVFPNIVASSATVAPEAFVASDSGVVLLQRSVVSNRAKLGYHCHVNVGALVSHECQVKDFSTVAPHAVLCGGSSLGECVLVGANSTVNDWVRIDSDVVVGSGSVVTHDLVGPGTFAGNPVRMISPTELHLGPS